MFQTADYARALLLAAQTDTSDEAIDPLVKAKLDRALILNRADPPEVVALIDELVLIRLIGLSEQVECVCELQHLPVEIAPAYRNPGKQRMRSRAIVRRRIVERSFHQRFALAVFVFEPRK